MGKSIGSLGKRAGAAFRVTLLLAGMASGAWAQANGNGLYGEYYNTNNFTGAIVLTRTNEGPITFDYVAGGPGAPVNVDNFSIRWRGRVEAPATEVLTFIMASDDVSRLYINGVLLVSANNNTVQANFNATAGQRYDVMIEFVENGGNANVHFRWSSPSIGAAVPVPLNRLYSPTVVPPSPTITPNGGVTPLVVNLSTTAAGGQIFYTVDGSDPGFSTPQTNSAARLFTRDFPLNIYARVQARVYLGDGLPSNLVTSNQFTPNFEPLAITPTTPGVYSRYYHLNNPQVLPNFDPLVPQRRGVLTNFGIALTPARDRNDQFGFKETGYISIPQEGLWTFFANSDDGSKLYIGSNEVVSNDGLHGSPGPTPSGTIQLKAGWHPITVVMFENGGGEALTVQWRGPSVPAVVDVPPDKLATDPVVGTPTLSPVGGTFAGSQLVTLNLAAPPAGTTIYYTLDGSPPDLRGATASGPPGLSFTITATTRVRALAVAPSMQPSDIADATYTRTDLPPRALSVTAAGVASQVVVLFDRPVTNATASEPLNYTISNGATVSAATLLPKTGALRGYWTLDDLSGTDSSGKLNTATLLGGPVNDAVTFAPLGFANAGSLVFDGVDDRVSVPDSASLNFGASSFTLSLWIRPVDTTNRRVLSKWDGPNDKGWNMDINSTAGNLRFRVDDGPNATDLNIGAGIVANQWQHVAGRCDRITNVLSIFRNGVLIGTANMSTAFALADNTIPVLMGRLENPVGTASGNHFSGRMDDVRIYGAALSDAEIAALAAGVEQVSATVRLTTSALTPGTAYTLTVRNVRDTGGIAIPAAGQSSPFRYFATGTLTREFWNGPGGVSIAELARNAAYPNTPSGGNRPTLFEAPQAFGDNYGTRMRGFFIPNATGNWKFSVASDDNSQLWLSPDDDPTAKVLISRCNDWSNFLDYADPNIFQSAPIPLVSGQKYYIEGFMKEGGGGDNFSVAAKMDDGTPIAVNTPSIAGTLLAPYDDALVLLTTTPGRVVQVGTATTFTVDISGAGPKTYQWNRNGTPVGGATAASLTLPGLVADSGTYTVVVTNGINTLTTSGAVYQAVAVPAPTIASITPTQGPAFGGQQVLVTGSNLLFGQTTLQLGATNATNLTFFADGQSLIARTPPRALGAVNATIATPGGGATAAGAYTYYDTPTIAAVNPNGGPVAGGQTLTVTGTLFVPGQTTVTFDTAAATSVNVTSPTTLTLVTPAHAAGPVTVTVGTPFGFASLSSGFTYYDPPTITGIAPANGPVAGGQPVTITGTNFIAGQTTVTFDATAVTAANLTPTQFTVVTPAHAAGAIVVTVTTPGGPATTSYAYHDPPTIATVSPDAGPTGGGQAVAIQGTNFVPGFTAVTFGGATAVVVSTTAGQLEVTSPPHAAGLVDIVVTTPGGTATRVGGYIYFDAPTITSILPVDGPSSGAQTLLITGTNFAPGRTAVTFGEAAGASVSVAPNGATLSVVTPLHAAGTFNVRVLTPGGFATASAAYTYHDPPTIAGVAPGSGTTQGGQTVTITGTNFVAGQTTVAFGGTAGSNVIVSGTGSLTVLSPAHSTGSVDVAVTTPGGTATSAAAYSYSGPFISSINPVAGPVAGGQTLTLTGTGFVPGATSLQIGGVAATVNSVTATSINATSPPSASPVTVDVSVTTPDGTYVLSAGYSYVGLPTITAVSPTRGPASGGATVVIDGTNFAPGNMTVALGGSAATIVSSTITRITATTSSHSAGIVDVVVTTFGNQPANAAGAYTYVPAPTVTSIVPKRGPIAGGQTVLVRGEQFEPGQAGLTLGGIPATGVVVSPDGRSLTASTGAHAPGTVDVVVTTFGLQSGRLAAGYTYVDPQTSADLSLGMIVDDPTPNLGQVVTFTLTVSNGGGMNATGILITDLLPQGLDFVAASPSQGDYSPLNGEWLVGALSNGSSATLSLSARVSSSDLLSTVAEVTVSDQPDLDSTPGNGVDEEDDRVTLSLRAQLTIQNPGPLASTTSGAFVYQPFAAAGGVGPYRWSLASGSLPFNLDPLTGTVSGTAPTVSVATPFAFTLRVTDGQDPAETATAALSITVQPVNAALPMVHTAPAPPAGIVGAPYSFFFTASEGSPPYRWTLSSGALPSGLTLHSRTGRLAGTPATVGSSTVTLQCSDDTGSLSTQSFTLSTVANAVEFQTRNLRNGAVGSPYHQTVDSSGGIGPAFTWTVASGTLPAGLSLSGTGRTATLSGTPTAPGVSSFVLRVSDGGQPAVSQSRFFTLMVFPAGGTPAVATDLLAPGTIGRPFSATLTAAGGSPPYQWSVASGRLPSGFTLDAATGVLSGTSTEEGFFPITVRVSTAGTPLSSASRHFDVVVTPVPLIVTESPLPPAVSGEAYFAEIAALGGLGPYRWNLQAGALPTGLSLNPISGVLSGVVSGASSSFTLRVTDSQGAVASMAFALNLLPASGGLTAIDDRLARAEAGVPYSTTLQALGGTHPLTWTLVSGALPAGITLDGATGALSGTSALASSAILTFQVTDSTGASAPSNSLTLEVMSGIQATGGSPPDGVELVPYTTTFGVSGMVGAFRWTVVEGTFTDGLVLEQETGTLSGPPAARGSSAFRVRVTDSLGRSSSMRVSFTVNRLNPSGSSGRSCGVASAGGPSFDSAGVQGLLLLLVSGVLFRTSRRDNGRKVRR